MPATAAHTVLCTVCTFSPPDGILTVFQLGSLMWREVTGEAGLGAALIQTELTVVAECGYSYAFRCYTWGVCSVSGVSEACLRRDVDYLF